MRRTKLPAIILWALSNGLLFLLFMTLMRLALFLFFNHQAHTLGSLGSAFRLGFRFDVRMVCLLMLVMMVAGSIPPFDPFRSTRARKIWNLVIGLITFLVVLVYIVDFAHYAYLSQRLNASVLNYLQDAGISMHMVWQSYPVIRLVIALIAVSMLLIWIRSIFFRRIQRLRSPVSFIPRVGWFVFFFLLFALGIFGRINQYPLRWSDAFQLGDDYRAQLALNPFESFLNTLQYRHSGYDLKKAKQYYPLLAQYFDLPSANADSLNYRRQVIPKDTLTSKPNVVLVICESFSGYKSSMWGNPLDPTPYFNQLCQQGIFFDKCFTPTYGTARGVWAVITGIPDVEIANTASRNPAAVDQHTIINDYKGYEKFYFIGGSASWANIRGLLTNNIDGLRLYEEEDFKAGRIDVWGVSDKNLMLEANKILATQSKPFFAVIQTADNHRPYTIPKEDEQKFKKISFPRDSLLKYGFESNEEMNAFRYTDYCFQQFMESAKKESYFNNTIFVFVGDHGIPGNAGDQFPAAWTEQRLTSEHVPLLFYAPHLIRHERRGEVVSQIDVLPIAAGLSKIPYRNTTLGRDVLDSSFRGKDFAFIFDPDTRMIGVVTDSLFYRKGFLSETEEAVPVIRRNVVPDAAAKKRMHDLTEGMFETSKYLLLNNKKDKTVP